VGEGQLERGELRRSINNGAEEGRDPASVKADSAFFSPDIFHRRDILDGLAHMLTLGLHLGLDRVERMADNGVSGAIEEPADRRSDPLLVR